jgi:progranulin
MFFPEYWGFESHETGVNPLTERGVYEDASRRLRREYIEEDERLVANASAQLSFRPAFAIHGNEMSATEDLTQARARHMGAAEALAGLQKRAFQCPSGTLACSSISQPNYCCATGEDCFNITDTGLGPVGCCPSGSTCAGEITSCASGQTACPQNMGGACCVAGFVCFDVGCVSTVSVTVIQTVTQSPSTTRPTTVTTTSTPVCDGAANFTPCPASLGGGCCLSGRVCETGLLCPLPGETTTASAVPPARGTGETTVSISSTTIISGDACPTGFYACSAYYPGAGCCRIGRDCSQTFCPSTASITIISAGKTVVVPSVPDATTTASGSCAIGWAACAADVGGQCCPSGWTCGSLSCSSAGPSATVAVAKEQPVVNGSRRSSSSARGLIMAMIGFAIML